MIEGVSIGQIHMFNCKKSNTGHGIFLVTLYEPGFFGCSAYFSIYLAKTKCVMEGVVDELSLC